VIERESRFFFFKKCNFGGEKRKLSK